METLLEIARFVTSRANSKKSVDAVFADDTDGVLSTFLRGLVSNTYADDDTASASLYGSDRHDQRYRTLKSRAYDRLLQALLLLEVRKPAHSEYMMYYHRCGRNLVAARTLVSFGSRSSGIRIAEKTLVVAKKYQFTEFTLHLLTLLRESYAILVDKRRFLDCTQQIDHYMQLLEAELMSDEILDRLQMETRQRKLSHEQLMSLSKDLFIEHSALVEAVDSHKVQLQHYRLSVIHHALRGNLADVNVACDDARSYLATMPHLSQPARIGEFGILKLQACVYNQQAHLIVPELDSIRGYFTTGGMNWYITLEFGILACLQCGDYQRAYDLWVIGQEHASLNQTSPRVKETWYLFEAYLHVLDKAGMVKRVVATGQITVIEDFTAAAPEFSKERKVFNTHVLFTQICLMILQYQHDAATRRIEHLRVYVTQYLKPDKDSNVRWFISQLVDLAKVGFVPDRVKSTRTRSQKQGATHATLPKPEEFHEMVPLEALYDNLMTALESRQSR